MKELIILLFMASLAIQDGAAAGAEPLDGLWLETANYPASSVIRFERTENGLVGKYAQVSTPQRHWGFMTDEVVIRGRLLGSEFKGEVLLKVQAEQKAACPQLVAGWVPIEMEMIEPGKLYGRWRQTIVQELPVCRVIGHAWQLYGLERLQVK